MEKGSLLFVDVCGNLFLIDMNPPKVERNALLAKMRDDGKSFRDLAKYFNIDVRAVWEIYKREKKEGMEKSLEKPT